MNIGRVQIPPGSNPSKHMGAVLVELASDIMDLKSKASRFYLYFKLNIFNAMDSSSCFFL